MNDQIGFSKRSVDALVEIVDVLRGDEDRTASADTSLDAARAIKYVFDNLAWSDGHLRKEEVEHLHTLLDNHEWLKNAYVQIEAVEPSARGLQKIPQLLIHALDYDDRNGTHKAPMLINALEMISFGVINSDGDVTDEELAAFRSHMAAMRAFTQSA